MATPGPPTNRQPAARGLRLLDLVGFVAGFGLASLLARTVWPRFLELSGPPAVAFGLVFLWLGLAMSGPIILGLDPRRPSSTPPRRPERSGRPISEVRVVPRTPPEPSPPIVDNKVDYSRAELAWLGVGGYWIALTFFVVPARTTDAPWTLAGLIPVVAALFLMRLLPRRPRPQGGSPPLGWTHAVGVGLLWTWPIAWGLLFLLGRTF